MTAQPIPVDVAAGQDAQARIDDGIEQPGDRHLADRYDAYCQQEQARLRDAAWLDANALWLDTQCPKCVDGGTGPVCDDCSEEAPS